MFLVAGLTTNTMVSVGAPLAQMSVTGSINGPVSSIGNNYDDTFNFIKCKKWRFTRLLFLT